MTNISYFMTELGTEMTTKMVLEQDIKYPQYDTSSSYIISF